jgi:hypothetical protein
MVDSVLGRTVGFRRGDITRASKGGVAIATSTLEAACTPPLTPLRRDFTCRSTTSCLLADVPDIRRSSPAARRSPSRPARCSWGCPGAGGRPMRALAVPVTGASGRDPESEPKAQPRGTQPRPTDGCLGLRSIGVQTRPTRSVRGPGQSHGSGTGTPQPIAEPQRATRETLPPWGQRFRDPPGDGREWEPAHGVHARA